MATLQILDAAGNTVYLKGRGVGTEADPFEPHQLHDSAGPKNVAIYKSMFKAEPHDDTNRNQNVDGSVTPVRFSVAPPAGQVWQITRMIILLRDGGTFDSGGWGNNGGSPLANGMKVGLTLDGTDIDMTPIPWVTVADLAGVAYDLDHHAFGSGDEFITVRLTISKAGTNLRLDGDKGDSFWMEVRDNLTHLTEQRCMCQGFIEDLTWDAL